MSIEAHRPNEKLTQSRDNTRWQKISSGIRSQVLAALLSLMVIRTQSNKPLMPKMTNPSIPTVPVGQTDFPSIMKKTKTENISEETSEQIPSGEVVLAKLQEETRQRELTKNPIPAHAYPIIDISGETSEGAVWIQ